MSGAVVQPFAEELWYNYGDFVSAQNHTDVKGKHVYASTSMADYSNGPMGEVSSTLENWTQLRAIPRDVYFYNYDIYSSAAMSIALFSFMGLFLLIRISRDLDAEDSEVWMQRTAKPGQNNLIKSRSNLDSKEEQGTWSEPATTVDPLEIEEEEEEEGRSSNYTELCTFMQQRLKPLSIQLREKKDESISLSEALLNKAVEYTKLSMNSSDNEIFMLSSLEGEYEEEEISMCNYTFYFMLLRHPLAQALKLVVSVVFMTNIFIEDVNAKHMLDVTVFTLITFEKVFAIVCEANALQGWSNLRAESMTDFGVLVVTWTLLFLEYWLGARSTIGVLLDFMRPTSVIVVSKVMKQQLVLMVNCLREVSVAVALYFVVNCIVGVMAYQLYRYRLTDAEEDFIDVDTFSKSCVVAFTLLGSADNYETFVYNIYNSVGVWSWMFIFPATMIGAFLMISMLLAELWIAYVRVVKVHVARKKKNDRVDKSVSFMLMWYYRKLNEERCNLTASHSNSDAIMTGIALEEATDQTDFSMRKADFFTFVKVLAPLSAHNVIRYLLLCICALPLTLCVIHSCFCSALVLIGSRV